MRICISSTFIDLIEYRNIALEVCDIFKAHQKVMELMFSKNESPVDASLELVRNSDIYICILGTRYGTIPDGYDKSITNLEYEEAIKLSKPIHVFITNDTKKEDALLQKFIDEVSQKHVYSIVQNKDDFRSKLLNTLRQNYFEDLKIDSKFLIDLEKEYFKLNEHGLAMDFVSNQNTLELLNIFSKNFNGLQNMINDVSTSNENLEDDLKELIQKLDCDKEKLKSIPYYENPFINRSWETINLGFPNWMNSLKLSFLNLQVRLLEYEVQRNNTKGNIQALENAKKELFDFIGVSHVD